MSYPDPKFSRRLSSRHLIPLLLMLALLPAGCGGTVVSKTEVKQPAKPAPAGLPLWLGNSQRNFYGSGPWQEGPLEIVWELETGYISGKLHADPWGGTSW